MKEKDLASRCLTRRRFMGGVVSSVGLACGPTGFIQGSTIKLQRDRFGGHLGMKFAATGFFRVEHDGHRWWFVTPLGHAFIAFGVNHYHADWWAQEYNRQHWLDMFDAAEPFDEKWNTGFREQALKDLNRLGLNSLGMHTTAPMLTDPPGNAVMPYVAVYEPLRLSHYLGPEPETYFDIFSSDFAALCDAEVKKTVTPHVNDAMILGYCMADCPALTDNEAERHRTTTWPRRLRNLGEQAAGKRAYVNFIRARYPDINDFNGVYETSFTHWTDLLRAENWRDDAMPSSLFERSDNAEFLLICIDRYYAVAKAALRKIDKNHLFFGDKLNGNTDALDGYLSVTRHYTDVVNVQFYGRWEEQQAMMDRWSNVVDQPFLNGDSAYTVPTATMPAPHGPHARDHAERAKWTREFMEQATARNDFVGWHMCGIIDTSKTMIGKENAQHQGIMTTSGNFYPEMESVIADLSSRLYEIALQSRHG